MEVLEYKSHVRGAVFVIICLLEIGKIVAEGNYSSIVKGVKTAYHI